MLRDSEVIFYAAIAKFAGAARYRDVRENGVLEEGIALVCGCAIRERLGRNGAQMGLIQMPGAHFVRAAPIGWIGRSLAGRAA
ncbi:hypothetical protein GCM10027343_25950 [Noviherbaspirillum agri]